MTEFIMLLDVDGVLNASKAGWHRAPHKGYAYSNGRQWTMKFEPEAMSALRKLHTSGLVEIKWATTWVGQTDQLERLFKLPPLLSAASTSMSGFDKAVAADEVLKSGKKLIWIDDQFAPSKGDYYDEFTNSGQALFIAPNATRGLRPEHLDEINKFVLGS